jgi:protein involved in polysaccharide export with SLBB domain
LVCAVLLVLASCRSDLSRLQAEIPEWEPQPPVAPIYRTAPGDVLVVEYARRPPSQVYGSDYRVDAGDRLSIVFENRPEYSRDVVVRPDGKFTYFRVGDVEARGRTAGELTRHLIENLKDVVPDPTITVFVDQPESIQDDFFEMLLAGAEGASREVNVREDGTISLPLLGQMPISNLTVGEAEAAIESAYGGEGIHIRPSLNVRSLGSSRYAVLGEVAKPGTFAITPGVTVVDALASVGGSLVGADLTQVVWVTRDAAGRPSARTLDVEGFLGGIRPGQNPVLQSEDVIYVPRSTAGDVNRFIDLYVRRNMPFNFSVGAAWRL